MDIGLTLLFDGQPGNSITDAGPMAAQLEEIGFSSLWLPDHVVVFEKYQPNYAYSEDGLPPYAPRQGWFDPMFALAAIAAHTSKIRIGTDILILPQRNPVIVAKEAVALDHLSGGRFNLGVGLGWSSEEYAALGVPFERRGARFEEYIAAMTTLWQDDNSTFEGEFVSFRDAVALPKPVQRPRIPVLVGGQGKRALRRAARLGDGWISWQLPLDELGSTVDQLDAECEAAGRDPASLRKVTTINYTTAQDFEAYIKLASERGIEEITVVPMVPDRDPQELLAEIAKVGGLM